MGDTRVLIFTFNASKLGIKLSDDDFAQYKNFPVVVSSRWQHEVCETVWNIVNADRDRDDERLTDKQSKAFRYAQGKDIIVWGPCLRLGGPFQSQWQRFVVSLIESVTQPLTQTPSLSLSQSS